MADSGNVDLGPGLLYVAPLGTAEPTSASAALPSAWREIGYTEQGNAFTSETTSEPVEVAEELDPIRYVNTRRLSSIAFEMAEVTRQNLALALNVGANEATSGSLEPPDSTAEVRVMIVFDTDSGARWVLRQCYQSGTVELASRKAPQKRLIASNFRLEKPTGATSFIVFPNADGLV
jgi:hypothetical protein